MTTDADSEFIQDGAGVPDADQQRIEEARRVYQQALGRGAGLIGSLSEITKDFTGIGRASLACSICLSALKIALSRYGTLDVVASDVEQITADCAALLGGCLAEDVGLPAEERMTPAARLRVLHLLYDLWWFDIAAGGLSAAPGMESDLFRGATAEERSLLSQWLWRDGRYHNDLPRLWHVMSREYFRAMLETGEEPGDELLLNKFRANRLHEAAAALLIDMDRPEEALLEGRQSRSVQSRIRIADALTGCGEEWVEPALALLEERLKTAEESRDETTAIECLRWIIRRCEEIGQAGRGLDAARRWFQLQPGYSTYLRVRSLGEGYLTTEKWRDLRDGLLSVFKEQRDWDTLIRILLNEGNIREAKQQLAAAVEREDPARAALLRDE